MTVTEVSRGNGRKGVLIHYLPFHDLKSRALTIISMSLPLKVFFSLLSLLLSFQSTRLQPGCNGGWERSARRLKYPVKT